MTEDEKTWNKRNTRSAPHCIKCGSKKTEYISPGGYVTPDGYHMEIDTDGVVYCEDCHHQWWD